MHDLKRRPPIGRAWCWALIAGVLLAAGAAMGATIQGTVTLDGLPSPGVEVTLMQFEPNADLQYVPTLGPWGLVVTSLILASIGIFLLLRRRTLGRWSSMIGLLLLVSASSIALVDFARSDDPVTAFTDASGQYQFINVANGNWGLTAYRDGYQLASSSGDTGGLVPVALVVSNAAGTYSVNLHMQTASGSCPAPKGTSEPEPVPPHVWATIKSGRAWAEVSGVQKAGEEIREFDAQLVRLIGSDMTLVIAPMTSPSLQAHQSRFFVTQFDGAGATMASYVVDMAEPANAHASEELVVPDLIRLSTPDGRLISEARFQDGNFVSSIDGPGIPRTASCLGFAKCLLTKWKTVPGWIRRICFNKCRQCWTAPAFGPCAVCVTCVLGYVAYCWCTNPCP